VTWDATKKTGTFTMPGGDVMLTPIYAAATVYGSDGQTEKSAYASLKEAFLAAQNGDIIKLDGDVTVTSATDLMTSNRATEDPVQFTIDFNGHVLDGSSVGTTFMNTEHEGDQITFIDSSTGEVGGLKGMVSGKKNSFVFAGGRYSFKGMTAAEIEDMWSTTLVPNGYAMAEGKKFVDLNPAPDANGFTVGIGLADYDISFSAANANTIEAGKAIVTIGGTAATLTEGKVTGVNMGQQVKMTAAQGYKFRKVEAKKGAKKPTALSGALE
jgi:cold shock CspA family protein